METTLFYLFSAIAQTYGAILGVMGMLAVYRLQVLREVRRGCRDRLSEPLLYFFGMPSLPWDSNTIVGNWEKKFPDGVPVPKHSSAEYEHGAPEIATLKANIKEGGKVRKSFYAFLKVHLPVIVISLLSIIMVDFLKSFFWWWILLIVFLVLLFSSVQIVRFSRSMLSGE